MHHKAHATKNDDDDTDDSRGNLSYFVFKNENKILLSCISHNLIVPLRQKWRDKNIHTSQLT